MNENFFSAAHLEIIIGVVIPVALSWWDGRRQRDKQHRENSERLIRIETKIEPMWAWFNNGRNQ